MINQKEKAKRLAATRTANNMSQQDLAMRLSELTRRTEPLSIPTISSWETGRRAPSRDMLNALAKLYQVSVDYLECLTDEPTGKAQSTNSNSTNNLITIPFSQLKDFDGKPVFITFKNYAHAEQWGIINVSKNAFILRDGVLKFENPNINTVCIEEPYYAYFGTANGRYSLDITKLVNTKNDIWVEMKTSDQYICGLYNGWFRHNETHTCLINNNGLTLPYEGVGISYHAYLNRRALISR